jgi:hypothetical protein
VSFSFFFSLSISAVCPLSFCFSFFFLLSCVPCSSAVVCPACLSSACVALAFGASALSLRLFDVRAFHHACCSISDNLDNRIDANATDEFVNVKNIRM